MVEVTLPLNALVPYVGYFRAKECTMKESYDDYRKSRDAER
jgi:hypothetical protein